MKNIDPCSICENFMNDNEFECDISDNCPIAAMKSENERLKKTNKRQKKKLDSLQKEINQLKSDLSWDLDARYGQIHGMW